MAQRVNMSVKGKFVTKENGELHFVGITPNGGKADITVKAVVQEGERKKRINATKETMGELFSISLSKSFNMREGTNWKKNKAKVEAYKAELNELLEEENILVFSSVGGVYRNHVFEGESTAEKIAVKVNGETGQMLTIKPAPKQLAGERAVNIDFTIREAGRQLSLGSALKGAYDASKISIGANLNAFSTVEDLKGLAEIDSNFMAYREEKIKAEGKVPVFGLLKQGEQNDGTKISPQLWFTSSRAEVYAHFGGQEGFVKAFIKHGHPMRVTVEGKEVNIDESNIDEQWPPFVKSLGKQRKEYIGKAAVQIEKSAPDYVGLIASLADGDEEIVEIAKKVQKFNELVRGVSLKYVEANGVELTKEQYQKNVEALIVAIEEAGGMQATPVKAGMKLSVGSGREKFKKLNHEVIESIVKKVADSYVATTTKIARRYLGDKPLKGNYIPKVKENIAKILSFTKKDGKNVFEGFKPTASNNTVSGFAQYEVRLSGVHAVIPMPTEFEGETGEIVKPMTLRAFTVPKTGKGDVYIALKPLPGGFSSSYDEQLNRKLGIPLQNNRKPKVQISEFTFGQEEAPAQSAEKQPAAEAPFGTQTEAPAPTAPVTEESIEAEAATQAEPEAAIAAVESGTPVHEQDAPAVEEEDISEIEAEVADATFDDADLTEIEEMESMDLLNSIDDAAGMNAASQPEPEEEEEVVHPNQGSLL